MRFISRNVRRSISSALLALLAGCAPPGHAVAGRWQFSWRGRIGTEQATVVLQQRGRALTGSFGGAHGSLPHRGIPGAMIALVVVIVLGSLVGSF